MGAPARHLKLRPAPPPKTPKQQRPKKDQISNCALYVKMFFFVASWTTPLKSLGLTTLSRSPGFTMIRSLFFGPGPQY